MAVNHIQVSSYTIGANTMTLISVPQSASMKSSVGYDWDNVNATAELEITSSQRAMLMDVLFEKIPVISVSESNNAGSFVQTMTIPRPRLHQSNLNSNNLTIKLRSVKSVSLTEMMPFNDTTPFTMKPYISFD